MPITFDYGDWVFVSGSNQDDDAAVLKLTLEYFIRINQLFLKSHPHTPSLYRSGVVYGRTNNWDPIPRLYEKRFGDCKSLTAALIAEYRNAGKLAVPNFRWVRNQDGTRDFHILVQTIAGFEDPSKRLGMTDENAHFFPRNAR